MRNYTLYIDKIRHLFDKECRIKSFLKVKREVEEEAVPEGNIYHVFFYDSTNDKLKYAYSSDLSSWNIEDVDSGNNAGECEVDIKMDVNNIPHILYEKGGATKNLIYAHRTGGSWTKTRALHASFWCSESLGDGFGFDFDVNGLPTISFQDPFGGMGTYHVDWTYDWDGSQFNSVDHQILTHQQMYVMTRSDHKWNLDYSKPFVVLYDYTSSTYGMNIYSLYKEGGVWIARPKVDTNDPLANNADFVYGPKIDFLNDGNEVVCYVKDNNVPNPGSWCSLRTKKWNGSSWNQWNFDEGGGKLRLFSFWIDRNTNNRWGLWSRDNYNDLMLGCLSSVRTREVVLDNVAVDWAAADLDWNGNVIITYCETSSGDIKVVVRTGENTFTSPVIIYSGTTGVVTYCNVKCDIVA